MINFFMTVFATIVFIAVIVFLNYEYLNLKIGTKTQKIRQLNFDIKEFLTQKNDIQRLLDDLKNESLKVENLVNDLKSSKSDIENQLNQLSSELAKTKTNIQKLLSIKLSEEEKTIQLQESIKISQNLLTTLNLEVSKFKSEKENSEQQFKVAKENLVEIQIALSSAKKQKDNFQLEVSTLNRLIAEKKNSTTHENVDIITFEPELNERIRGEVKHIGYAPNNLFKQENQTNYPYVSMPLPKSVIKFPRKVADGRIGIRGYKEVDFDIYIKRYFSNDGQMTFFNDRFLFISNYTKPYVPDQVLIDEKNDLNLFIDIEIDEPYDGIGRLSTHEKGKDVSRNKYFNDRGWLVIRFAEIQVQNNILGCCKHIAKVVKSVNPNFKIHTDLLQATDIELIPIWNKLESDRWSKENYREEYLGISSFGVRERGHFDTSKLKENEDDIKSETKVIQTTINFEDEVLPINNINAHVRDKRLKFLQKEHIYLIDDNPNTISGTTFIHKFFPDFDGPRIAPFVARNRGITAQEVLQEWENDGKKSAELGTVLHSDIEEYFNSQKTSNTIEFNHFLNLIPKLKNLELYRTEWRIFDDILMLAGTADTIFKKLDGTFVIFDWKRSKEIKQNGFPIFGGGGTTQKGIGVCNDIEDCNYQQYCLQLNLYKRILEEHYFGEGQISEMYFVQLHPNFQNYNIYKVPNMQNKINQMYNELLTLQN